MRFNMTAKNLNALMCANVRPEQSALLRITPLPLKTLAMRFAYYRSGESRYTTVLSNLGEVAMPEGMERHIDRLDFMLGPSHQNPIVAPCGIERPVADHLYLHHPRHPLQRGIFRRIINWGIRLRSKATKIQGTQHRNISTEFPQALRSGMRIKFHQ
jgi:hypothetical protein